MVNVSAIREHVVTMLKGLSPALTYHSVKHTLDVVRQSMRIAEAEGISDKLVLMELEIAALYHDTGFLYVYRNHEERGCVLANEQLPLFGVSDKSIENICSIIMATKIPQSPKNHLQEIICDADLDYLGRDDFFPIAEKLKNELVEYHLINNGGEWEETQWLFLKSHHYFTKTSLQERTTIKLGNMQKLIEHKSKIRE